MEEDSGKFFIEGDCLCYESTTYGNWRLPISSIRIIGEYTNQSGPAMDDYFFVFVVQGKNEWYEASFYAKHREDTWKILTVLFNGLAAPALHNSADFKSQVLWPARYEGQPFLNFQPMKRGDRLQDRVLDKLFPPFVVEGTLRDEFKV